MAAKKPPALPALYDVVPWIDMGPGKPPREGDRVTVEGAKAAAKEAIAWLRGERETRFGFGVRSTYVAPVGAHSGSSLLHCSRKLTERAQRLSSERRGGRSRAVQCTPTPSFKKLLAKKTRKKKH
jgi:hypothetical protein